METTDGDYLQVGFEEELLADGGGETQDDDAEETQQDGLVVGVGSQILSFISFLETHLEVVGDEVDEDDGGVLETLRLLERCVARTPVAAGSFACTCRGEGRSS